MVTGPELEQAFTDADDAMRRIIGDAETFAEECARKWNDDCGKRIGESIVATVEQAVEKVLDLYECSEAFTRFFEELRPVITAIAEAQEELQ